MSAGYTVERKDGESETYVIRTRSGDIIKEDPDDPHYCDFLTWLSMQPNPSDLSYRDCVQKEIYYFAKANTLIEHLKSTGAMIYAQSPESTSPRRVISHDTQNIASATFFSLPQAHLREDDPEYVLYGFGGDERSGLEGRSSKVYVTGEIIDQINNELRDDHGEFRKLSSWAIERSFVYLDVSDFSKAKSGHQALIIKSIISIVNDDHLWSTSVRGKVHQTREAMLCIGDGYIFVFDNPINASYFAAYLAQLIESMIRKRRIVQFHFRMGVHLGRVFSFWDIGRGSWNYVGDGINGGNRVLSAIGKEADDIVFVSSEVRQSLIGKTEIPCPEILMNLQNRGRKTDKHGNPWRVYELNHSGLTANYMPPTLTDF